MFLFNNYIILIKNNIFYFYLLLLISNKVSQKMYILTAYNSQKFLYFSVLVDLK